MTTVKKFSDGQRREYVNQLSKMTTRKVALADVTDEDLSGVGMVPELEVPVEPIEPMVEEVMAPVGEIAELKKKFEDALKNEELDKDLKKQAEEMLAKIEELEKAMKDAKALVEKIAPPAPPVEEVAVAEVPAEVPAV